jgi:hypothetical protein
VPFDSDIGNYSEDYKTTETKKMLELVYVSSCTQSPPLTKASAQRKSILSVPEFTHNGCHQNILPLLI